MAKGRGEGCGAFNPVNPVKKNGGAGGAEQPVAFVANLEKRPFNLVCSSLLAQQFVVHQDEAPETENPQPVPTEEIEAEDLTSFRWNAMAAVPWDAGTYYFFLMPDEIFYNPALVAFPLEFAQKFQNVMSHFCTAASYAGLHRCAERLAGGRMARGEEPGEANLLSALGVQLVQQGIASFLPDFTHAMLETKFQQSEASAYPVAPLHLWAFIQACEMLEKDLLPSFEYKDGEDGYPFGEIAQVRQDALEIRETLWNEIRVLMEGMDVYRYIADLRTLGALTPDDENEATAEEKNAS